MYTLNLLATFLLAGLGAASPVPDFPMASVREISQLYSRQSSSCVDPQNTPWDDEIYTCPHTNQMTSNGSCVENALHANQDDNFCISYCEVKNSWFPGPEEPFANSACQAGDACSLAESKATAITNSWSINLGFNVDSPSVSEGSATAGFNAGASFTFTETTTYTTTETHERPSNSTSECGYWTFVPFYLSSCGSLGTTEYGSIAVWGGIGNACNENVVLSTTGNWCNPSPYVVNGVAQGEVVFVNTNCNGGGLLPMDQQDYIYQYSGVSRGVEQN